MKILILSVLLAITINAADYWKECDFNGNGKIDTRKTYKADVVPKEIAKKETKCRGKKNLAKSKSSFHQSLKILLFKKFFTNS